tara:strand:+ start:596 stop:1600 length:1005 start_codon:yes stop_codon:yes gene_type:complete
VNIQIQIDTLREKKLFVAVPMYGGQCAGMFCKSTNDLSALGKQYGVEIKFYYLFNESLVTRARNYCADEFMRSDSTHLMFIDSDIGFNANDVIAMLAMSDGHEDLNDGKPHDIMCGPYPKKCISWEKIKHAVDQGVADEDPNVLSKYVGDYVFNPVQGGNQIKLDAPARVLEGGTGFMLIRRQTFERFNEAYPNMLYKPDHVRTAEFDGSREIMAYFDALIDDKYQNVNREIDAYLTANPKATHDDIKSFLSVENKRTGVDRETYSNRYLSEDYMFCQWVINLGMDIWLCPWMQLQHVGSYVFAGSLADLASIGVTATADEKQMKKGKVAIETK